MKFFFDMLNNSVKYQSVGPKIGNSYRGAICTRMFYSKSKKYFTLLALPEVSIDFVIKGSQ